ncbi:DUF1697 domain-containing protein [Pseudonocardia tropica]
MADLRTVFEDLGFEDVSTYIQSGNVLFTCPEERSGLAAEIEQALAARFGKQIAILLRTASELAEVAATRPFANSQDDHTKLLVTFLASTPEVPAGPLETPAGETGELVLAGREVYVHTPDGYGRSKLGNTYLEKELGVAATTRNWKSVLALRDLLAGRA